MPRSITPIAFTLATMLARPAAPQDTVPNPSPETIEAAPATVPATQAPEVETTTAEVGATATTIVEQPAPPGPTPRTRPRFTAAAQLGVGFSQVLSELGTTPAMRLEGGILLPWLGERIAVLVTAGYRRPKHTETLEDPRMPAPSTTELVEDELIFAAGGLGRWFTPGTQLNFFGRAAFQLHLQRSTERGDAGGLKLGANREHRTTGGFVFGGGAEWLLGPGAVTGELLLDAGQLDHTMTGNATSGGLTLLAGYNLVF